MELSPTMFIRKDNMMWQLYSFLIQQACLQTSFITPTVHFSYFPNFRFTYEQGEHKSDQMERYDISAYKQPDFVLEDRVRL